MSLPTEVEKLADTLVERLNLHPPVDILALTQEVADVEELEWSFNCDGLAVDLSSKRPKVFLRQQSPPYRKRFTAAHEYGHIRISWHVDVVQCLPDPTALATGVPEGSDRDLGRTLAQRQEWEANRFASRLLLPHRFLQEIAGYREVSDLLKDLAVAEVSASAGIIALAKYLPPGYIFHVPGLQRPIVSSRGTRTSMSPDEFGSLNLTVLNKSSTDSGSLLHQGQTIRWWQMAKVVQSLADPGDSRSATEDLRDAIEAVHGSTLVVPMVHKINGKTAGLLSQAPDVSRPEDIVTLLRYRLAEDPAYAGLLGDPVFDIYLTKRAFRYAEKRGES
jgi:hypothetical protein